MAQSKKKYKEYGDGDAVPLELIRAMHKTAVAAGIPMVSSDRCCQLLAWLYVFGGGNEEVVMLPKLRNDIMYAQTRLNLDGGEVPDAELTPILKRYIREAEDWEAISTGDEYERTYRKTQEMRGKKPPEPDMECPAWITDIEKRYNITSGHGGM